MVQDHYKIKHLLRSLLQGKKMQHIVLKTCISIMKHQRIGGKSWQYLKERNVDNIKSLSKGNGNWLRDRKRALLEFFSHTGRKEHFIHTSDYFFPSSIVGLAPIMFSFLTGLTLKFNWSNLLSIKSKIPLPELVTWEIFSMPCVMIKLALNGNWTS